MKTIAVCIAICLGMAWNAKVNADGSGATLEEWQLDLIYFPSDSMLEREAEGFVFIYDGLSDAVIEKILDDKYDRIEYMMFTRVKQTDTNGDTLIDPETGDELLVDDGCD